MTRSSRDPQAGVTLIEMLVAVAICALIGLAGFGMLDTILRVNDRTEGDLDQFADLDRTFLVLGRDLITGDVPALRLQDGELTVGTADGVILSYALDETILVRRVGTPEVVQTLITGVATAEWRVLDSAGNWQDSWTLGPPGTPQARAVEVRLDLIGMRAGNVRRIFQLTSGPAP